PRLSLPAALAVAVASGALLSLSQPPADLGPLAFVGLIPLFWLVSVSRPGRSFLLGLVFGFAYFACLLYWIVELTVLGLLALALAGVSLAAVLLPALTPIPAPNGAPLDVAIVQGNSFDQKLVDARRVPLIARSHAELQLRMRRDPPDLAIWPEDAVDLDPTRYARYHALVTNAVRAVGAPTLIGTIGGLQDGR